MRRIFGLLASATTLFSAGPGTAATLDDVVIHGKMAEAIREKNELSVVWAEKIAKHCIDEAASHNFGVAVAIIDQYGTIIYYYRGDGKGKAATESALGKAKTAWNMRAPSRAAINAVNSGNSSDARQIAAGNLLATGGLPIVVDNQFLGAIGVGGTAPSPTFNDEICGYNALTAILGPQPPLLPEVKPPARGG